MSFTLVAITSVPENTDTPASLVQYLYDQEDNFLPLKTDELLVLHDSKHAPSFGFSYTLFPKIRSTFGLSPHYGYLEGDHETLADADHIALLGLRSGWKFNIQHDSTFVGCSEEMRGNIDEPWLHDLPSLILPEDLEVVFGEPARCESISIRLFGLSSQNQAHLQPWLARGEMTHEGECLIRVQENRLVMVGIVEYDQIVPGKLGTYSLAQRARPGRLLSFHSAFYKVLRSVYTRDWASLS
ncbi:hypothetical protein BKA67DRAFT_540724 [Truncatella angustata]|uniref:Uncharacterized protein n=1 Tax=Truncatella angustata TaxID=152316 RepID=A0A9P8RQ37_9PEZI|nr:uncharacterized protein BKA67DRAFT_540724 [Truncatella angustata]KAH6647276.1 hypothetical protein BKA67DRAFT_540724 [Truncatella angustata]